MIGIIGAMEIEVNELKSRLQNPITKKISSVDFVFGKLHGKDVVIATSGVGKVFSAITAEAMILEYSPEIIINSGVAGSLSAELNIADIAIADNVCQHDMNTTALGDPPGLLSGINLVDIPASKKGVEILEKAVNSLKIPYKIGKIASGDLFVNTISQKTKIAEKFNAIACEMEGASIGQVCYVNGVEFAVLRSISDSLSDESGMEFSEFVKIAAENSINVIDEFIKEY